MHSKTYYLKKITSWLLPHTCFLCKNSSEQPRDICYECESKLPFSSHGCRRCAYPLPTAAHSIDCDNCLNQAPPFDITHALFAYNDLIRQLILQLKFKHSLINARILGEIMGHQIKNCWYANKPLPELIIPMPLHTTRLKERGFNQAVELARPIAKIIQRPIEYHGIMRIKSTAPQATLKVIERHKNLENAFKIKKPLCYNHVAIIDDVVTTGETAKQISSILKQSGIKNIDIWCIARAFLN